MQKLVFISNMPVPYQVKFCKALNNFFQTQFWFYDTIRERADWWQTELNANCSIIPKVHLRKSGRYLTRTHLQMLNNFNPDIVMLGGFSIPANYLAYRWAKANNKKVIVCTEVSRTPAGQLRNGGWQWTLLHALYKDVDAVFALTEDAYEQFKNKLKFGNKVIQSRYASDLDIYFQHTTRKEKDAYTLLFANRLTAIYNPLAAIRIFHKVKALFPQTRMLMNASGELRLECEQLIKELDVAANIFFLDHIDGWDKLHKEYERADILLFPANFSNGNFTIYEAMASGMGIIVSEKVLGNGKKVVNGLNGFNLPLDEDLFAGKIIQYISEPHLLTQHGNANKELVRPMGMEATAAFYHSLLSQLTSQP